MTHPTPSPARRRRPPSWRDRLADQQLLWRHGRLLRRAPAPIIIGGTGGSGTRALVALLQAHGVFAGSNLSPASDSRHMGRFTRVWARAYFGSADRVASFSAEQHHSLLRALRLAALKHRDGIPSLATPWLIKNPRSWLLLPWFAHVFPAFRYVHVVRDGRDMAFSRNQQQVERYGALFLGPPADDEPLPLRSMRFWSRTNLWIQAYGTRYLGDRYLVVRFEDLCFEPHATARRLLAFAGLPAAAVADSVSVIEPPRSIGRWRDQEPALLDALHAAGAAGLAAFGYAAAEGVTS